MNRSSRRAAGIGMVAGALSSMVLFAGPAHAAGLTMTLGCTAQGAGVMECWATTTGGVAPYTYHWSTTHSTSSDITFSCGSRPTTVTVTVTVTDTTGLSDTKTRSAYCPGGPPR